MTRIKLDGIIDERLGPLSLDFETGLSSVLGDDATALSRLAEILVGLRAPRRGVATLDDVVLCKTPQARRRVASLLHDESLPSAAHVEAAVDIALSLRECNVSARAALSRVALQRLLPLPVESLAPRELCAVGFAIALAVSDHCQAFVLNDPLRATPTLSASLIVETCRRLSSTHAVIVLGLSLEQALLLGGRCELLEHGRLSPYGALAAGPPVTLLVRSAEAARLAETLRTGGECNVDYDPSRSPRELAVSGPDPVTLSRHIVRIALEQALPIESLHLPDPGLIDTLGFRARWRST